VKLPQFTKISKNYLFPGLFWSHLLRLLFSLPRTLVLVACKLVRGVDGHISGLDGKKPEGPNSNSKIRSASMSFTLFGLRAENQEER
jgi:hypothetical protein